MSWLPDRDECLKLLEDEGCGPRVIQHCIAVEELALKIAGLCDADIALVSAGALLHDIGRSVTHDIWHVVHSVEILERRGVEERLVKIARKHLGAGLTDKEANDLGFPPGDYMPHTLEEKIVTYVDNLVGDPSSPDRKRTGADAAEELRVKGLDIAAERALRLHEEMCRICGMDIDTL